jgi:hypothetical protein
MKFISYRNVMGLLIAAGFSCGLAYGEPTGMPTTVETLRIIPSSSLAYVAATNADLCATTTFSFKVDTGGGIAMYATLLQALKSKSKVQLEVNTNKGCTGWGTDLMGLTVL